MMRRRKANRQKPTGYRDRSISGVAARLGLKPDPSAVQHVQLAFDAADRPAIMEFWRAALGYVAVGEEELIEPNLIGPPAWFQDKEFVPPHNRIHMDVSVPHDQAQARIDAVVAAGGRILGDRYAPAWVWCPSSTPRGTWWTSARGRDATDSVDHYPDVHASGQRGRESGAASLLAGSTDLA
jgi:hypothetical protein